MAFGVISAFAHQRVTIGTELALDIRITGNPDNVYIEGLLEGFHTNWNNPILQVRGAATRLVNNVQFTVKALKGTETPLSRAGTLSVVPAAPVITNPGKQKFVRGIENEFVVKISNSPSKVRASGPWVGMKYGSHPAGVRIFGIVPEVSNALPSAARRIRVTAESGDLKHELDIGFDLVNSSIYSSAVTTDIYRIQLNDNGKTVSSDLKFITDRNRITVISADDTYIYFRTQRRTGRVWFADLLRVPVNTGNGQTVNASRINDSVRLDAAGVDVDGDSLYLLSNTSGNRTIKAINKSNAATIKSFRISEDRFCGGLAIDGDDLIVLVRGPGTQDSEQYLRWYNKNTANGGIATHTKQVDLPAPNSPRNFYWHYGDIAVLGNKLFLTNARAKTITSIDIETGKVLATYTLPSSLPAMYGITIVVK